MISLTDSEFTTFTAFVKRNYGINLEKKRVLIEGRLSNTLKERGLSSFNQYLEKVIKDTSGKEVMELLNKITTNHTYFMREMEHFQFMFSHVLPYFDKTLKSRSLRIWSAGCSTGQEPYTAAMVLDEYFGLRKKFYDISILATDISMNALDTAKKATYTAESLKDIPQKWLNSYFVNKEDKTFEVCPKIKNAVVFKPFNLMEPFNFKEPFDLIFCRNVMIYFDVPEKELLIDKFYNCIRPGGFLFIGHSETINREKSRFTYIKPAIYRKDGKTGESN